MLHRGRPPRGSRRPSLACTATLAPRARRVTYISAMPPTVLIVDDDPVIQLLLRVNFEMEGFEVATAEDGEEGLARAREINPVLVLLDVMMPKLDGYQVLEQLRAAPAPADLPIVLLSAKSSPADRQQG